MALQHYYTSKQSFDSYFKVFLPLIMKKVFEKLAANYRREANTSLVRDWLKRFLTEI